MASQFKKRGEDYQPPTQMHTLPGKYYHDTGIYNEELEKIWKSHWVLACRAEQIPNAGDFITIEIGTESIIVVRDKEGAIHAHFNVCRHRGTRMCMEHTGTFENGHIQCPYHAWTYGLDGCLTSAPLMKEVEGFDAAELPLYQAHTYNWEGFIFISLAEEPVPFGEQMAQLIGRFADWHLSELRIAHEMTYELDCNWKLILQNYQECYHCPGVHPLLTQRTPVRSARHDTMEGAVIGGYMDIAEQGGSLTMDGGPAGPPVCDVHGDDLQRVYYYSVFPNMLLTPHPDFVMYHQIETKGIDKIRNTCRWLVHPENMKDAKNKERLQSAVEFWDITNREDWAVCEQMQMGTASKRFQYGHYASQEDVLHALDKEVLKHLGHKIGQ